MSEPAWNAIRRESTDDTRVRFLSPLEPPPCVYFLTLSIFLSAEHKRTRDDLGVAFENLSDANFHDAFVSLQRYAIGGE